jgi:hypothetical protein
MAVLKSIFSPVVVRRAPHWSDRGIVIASGPFYTATSGSGPQIRARIALARAASAAYGQRGFVNGIPVVAARVAAATAGQNHGGASPDQRREAAHQMAAGNIARMERASGMRGGAASAGGVGAASFF